MIKPTASLDLETDPFERDMMPEPFAGDFFDGETHFTFWGPDAADKATNAALCFKGLVFVHNGGRFDFHFMLPRLVELYGAENLKLVVIGSRIVSILCPSGTEFRDSYALIPKPLRAFGNKLEIDMSKLLRANREKHRAEITRYLKQDTEGLLNGVRAFIAEYGCKLTLASTSFDILRKRFEYKLPRTSPGFDRLFRKWYFAGRVQFFRLGECPGPWTVLDINSAFPWAMTLPHWFSNEADMRTSLPKNGAEQCFIQFTADVDGCLPVRQQDGGVAFPVMRNANLRATGWELISGQRIGKIRNVRTHLVYVPKTTTDFKPYVRHFYALKESATNEADRTFAKLLLNSLYGKFAQNPAHFRDVRLFPFDFIPPGRWEHCFDLATEGFSFWKRATYGRADPGDATDKPRPMRFSNVATAASITGCVRGLLMESMHRCRDVIYCDTDSIVARDSSALTVGSSLGEWKVEARIPGSFFIGGKKLYAGEIQPGKWKTASKGTRLTPAQIVNVARGESETHEFNAPSFSAFSDAHFTRRTVRRDDKRTKRN